MPINRDRPKDTILTTSTVDVDISEGYVLDRGFDDVLTLPFDFNDIKIKPNEIVTHDTFNSCLYKLYNNFLYLNSRCKMASSSIPSKFSGLLAANLIIPPDVEDVFVINSLGTLSYFVNNMINPSLTLSRGGTYTFLNKSPGHPFYISTQPRTGGYYHGIDNMGMEGPDGKMVFKVPHDAPDKLYYYCSNHPSSMNGIINIVDSIDNTPGIAPLCTDPEALVLGDTFQSVIKYDQCPDIKIPDKIIQGNTLSGAENISWFNTYEKNRYCEESYLADVRDMVAIDTEYMYGQFYLLFVATPTHLLTMELDFKQEYSPAIREYENKVEKANDIVFDDISSIAINPKSNYLYVADQHQNKIFQYTIENFTTNNITMRERGKILIKALGTGKGENTDRERFNSPVAVRVGSDEKVYVLDSKPGANAAIKVYDKNLNWLETIIKKNDFLTDKMVDIAIDKTTDYIYALNEKGVLFIYDNTVHRNLIKKYELMREYDDTVDQKTFSRIIFSNDENDIFYVVNESDVIKKWKSKLNTRIGFFNFNRLGASDMRWFNMCLYDGTYDTHDTAFVYGAHTEYTFCGRIFKVQDQNKFISLTYDGYKDYTFDYNQIAVKPGEFVTNIVINKSLLKILYNHTLFVNNLHSTYSGVYDEEGKGIYTRLVNLKDKRADVYNYDIDVEEMVGINEPLLAAVVNRPLEKLFNYQLKILAAIQSEYTNFYPVSSAPIFLR